MHRASAAGIGVSALAFMVKPGRLDASNELAIKNPFGISEIVSVHRAAR